MSPPSPFSGVDGLRGYSVGDIGGNVVEAHLPNRGGEEVTAAAAMIGNTFSVIGTLLGIGEAAIITARGESGSWVVAYQNGYSIAVDVESNVPTSNVEFAVRRGEWVPKVEWEIVDAEIQYVPPSTVQVPVVVAPPPKPAKDSPAVEMPRVPKPPAPRRNAESARPVFPSNAPNLATANARGLRRAFIRGDLKEARAIAGHLKMAFPSKDDPCGSGASADVIEPLITGIASTLSGDNDAALQHLERVSQTPDIGPSLDWIAITWCARASIASAEGLDKALKWAEAAGRLSKQLDVEARVVSARLVAEVCLYRKDLDHAERFADQARRLADSLADRDESGELSLLQARILLAAGKRLQAIQSAERAHAYRPLWVAPVVFLCRCALGESDLDRAQSLVAASFPGDAVPTEISRIARLLEAVRGSGVSTNAAAEFLELEESPASSACIARLEELAEAFPRLETVRDTLGWKLLKAGHRERASVVFERLSQRRDLPDDIRSSVLLALGYLAANKRHHSTPGAKVRATVEAAPRHLQTAKPATQSSSRMRVAKPIEMAGIEPPPASLTRVAMLENSNPAPHVGHGSPVFTGNLNHFCLPDVLEFLRAGRRTGTLLCSSVRGIGAVHLKNGCITGAAAPGTQSLRAMLLTRGKLTVAVADKAAALQQADTDSSPIGGVLVREGWASAEDVATCLRAQVSSAIAELLNWGDGQFAFDPEVIENSLAQQVEISLDPQAVLLDIYKGLDEQARELP